MKSIIRRTAGSKYYSKIDVDQGHLRHPLKEDDWKYTAIILDDVIPGIGDHVEFTSLPWGLTNSGRELQRLMDKLIRSGFRVEDRVFKRNMKGECCDVFQDDAIVYGKEDEELLEDTRE